MKTLLTTVICFLCISCYSQLSLDIGTKWTYTYANFGTIGPACVEVTGETIIDGTTWYSHEGVTNCAGNFEDILIRTEGQKVFMYYGPGNEVILYDFDLVAGESWSIPIPGTGVTYDINVLSVDTIVIGGEEYKIQNIDNWEFGSYIIEGIGSNKYFFPQGNICDPHYYGIRCFSNGNVFVDFDPEFECDELSFYLSTENLSNKLNVNVYPNPTADFVNVKCQSEVSIHNIELYDNAGKSVRKVECSPNVLLYNIELSELPSGVYFMNIKSDQGVDVRKIIKN